MVRTTRTFALILALVSACAPAGEIDDGLDQATGEVNPRLDPVRANPDARARRHEARYPIVLMHGFNASSNETLPGAIWSFFSVADALRADGHEVHSLDVPPFASIETRARVAQTQLDRIVAQWSAEHPGEPVKLNIVAHSMGGLDARHLISRMGWGARVASLTTISTPHRGSGVADFVLSLLPGRPGDAHDARLNELASVWGATYSPMADNSNLRSALEALSERNARAFNEQHPDDSRVYYQSFAGVSNKPPFTLRNSLDLQHCRRLLGGSTVTDLMHPLIAGGAPFVAHGVALLPNDGMVTVQSARRPDDSPGSRWVFRGCIPADHLDEVGQPRHLVPDDRTGFNHVRFYRNVAFELADMGF